ncbi:Pisatin demethylase [Cytospora mali]|uniref:Pisatin demethylase n=1 Tax=Cytospora mali TaxID=578113 RepID=A0A194V9T2_CYTMA|nr:Pisatin demethylase [Valsa mali var. pyri (nom. inval.)]
MANGTAETRGALDTAANVSSSMMLLYIPLSTFILWNLWEQLASPLRKYPGPFLAKYTNLWRLYHTSRGNLHLVYQQLHEKYGHSVRVGPNVVDVDLPELVKPIFHDIKGDWRKTEFYHASSAFVDGKIVYNIFSETDTKKHAREKRPIAKYYSPVGVAALEPHMDTMITNLCQALETRFMDLDKPFDLGRWVQYYAWDVVGSVTFSQPIGYLEKGYDFDGTLRDSESALDYFAVVGMIPVLDHLFDKNPVMHLGPPGFNTITGISLKHLADRYQGNDKDYHDPDTPDFLDRFIEAKNADPKEVDDAQIIGWLMINMIAGADTTAATLKSAFYHCLHNKRIWERLQQETLAAGLHKDTPVAYKDSHSIPYLEAVVREALRILPGVSMPLERYVPQGGHRLSDGSLLPEGSIVGLNPYILCRNKDIYGQDAEEFRPERWLRDEEGGETEKQFEERLAAMNSVDLTFGGGRRICIGKNLGLFQVYKVLATLATFYNLELMQPEQEWRITNSWFPRQEGGLEVKITKRVYA